MATEQVGTSGRVYRITRDYKNRDAYTFSQVYTDAYLKPLEERWQYNMRQAELNAAGRKDEYEAKMKIYQDAQKQQSNRELARDKAVYAAKSKAADAGDKAILAATAQEFKEREANQKLQEKRGEQTPVSQGGRSSSSSERQSSGTSGGGGGGPAVSSAQKKAQEGIQFAKAQNDPLLDPVGLAGNVRTRTGVGNIAATDPATADYTYHSTVEESISAKAGDLMRTGMPGDEARMQAESDVLAALEAGKASDFAEGWRRESNKKAAASGVGGGTSQSSGSSQSSSVNLGAKLENKYKGLPEVFADLNPDEQETILAEMKPSDRADLIKGLEARKFGDIGPMPVYEPTDILTEARRLQGKYFGKTVESPGFEQRNRMDELLRMSPEERAIEVANFQAGRAAPSVALPAAAPTGAAPAMVAPSPVRVAQLPAGVSAGIANMPSTPALQPQAVPRPTYTPPPASAGAIAYTPPGRGANYEPDIGTRPESEAPDNVPVEDPATAAAAQEARANIDAREANARRQQVANRRAELEAVLGRRAQDTELIDSMMSQGFGGSSVPTADLVAPGVRPSVPRPVYVPTQTADVIPSMATRIAGAPPASMGARPEGVLPPSIPVAGPSAANAAPRLPVFGTPESRAMMRKDNETPGMITGGTNLILNKAQKAEAEEKQKADEAAVKGKGVLGAAKSPLEQESYYESRINAAMLLKDQPDKLKRLAASGSGRVGLQLYTTNKAKGFPFQSTFSEIVNTFAGDKEAMTKAHDVALATAFAAYDSLNPKA